MLILCKLIATAFMFSEKGEESALDGRDRHIKKMD